MPWSFLFDAASVFLGLFEGCWALQWCFGLLCLARSGFVGLDDGASIYFVRLGRGLLAGLVGWLAGWHHLASLVLKC